MESNDEQCFFSEGGAARCPDHSDQAYCLHKVSVTMHSPPSATIIAVFYPHIPTMTQYHHAGILSVMIVVGICQWQYPTVELKQCDSRPIEFLLLSGLVVVVGRLE